MAKSRLLFTIHWLYGNAGACLSFRNLFGENLLIMCNFNSPRDTAIFQASKRQKWRGHFNVWSWIGALVLDSPAKYFLTKHVLGVSIYRYRNNSLNPKKTVCSQKGVFLLNPVLKNHGLYMGLLTTHLRPSWDNPTSNRWAVTKTLVNCCIEGIILLPSYMGIVMKPL